MPAHHFGLLTNAEIVLQMHERNLIDIIFIVPGNHTNIK